MRSVNSLRASTAALLTGASAIFASLTTAPIAFAQDNPATPPQGMAALPIVVAGTGGAAGFGGPDMGFFGPPTLVNPSSPVPGNGGFLIRTNDSFNVPQITVSNASTPSVTIGGTITLVNGTFWVWVATTPLPAGTYTITMSAPDGGGGFFTASATVEVTAAWTPELPEIDTTPSATWVGMLTTSICCQTWIEGFGLDIGNCFGTEQAGVIELSAGLTSPTPLANVNQFLYRVRPEGSDETLFPFTGWGSQTPITFSVQAEEYCFEIDAMDITTQEVTTYTDLSPACAPHGNLADLGSTVIETDDSSLDHFLCNSPPVGFEERWCDLNEAACADAPTASGCQVYGHVCRDEPLPAINGSFAGMFVAGMGGFGAVGGAGNAAVGGTSGASGIGGSGGSGGSGGRGGSGKGGAPDEDEEAEPAAKSDSGCSVSDSHATRTPAASTVWLLAMAGAALRLRGRRRR